MYKSLIIFQFSYVANNVICRIQHHSYSKNFIRFTLEGIELEKLRTSSKSFLNKKIDILIINYPKVTQIRNNCKRLGFLFSYYFGYKILQTII